MFGLCLFGNSGQADSSFRLRKLKRNKYSGEERKTKDILQMEEENRTSISLTHIHTQIDRREEQPEIISKQAVH